MGVPLGFRFVLAVNKIDLLPGNYSPRRLEVCVCVCVCMCVWCVGMYMYMYVCQNHTITDPPTRPQNWIRARAKQGGLPKPDAVQLLSSTKGKGALDLHGLLKKMLGPRGDVWVIGAQNAGKSSLINSMRRCAKLPPSRDLTTAVLPGTTLGMFWCGCGCECGRWLVFGVYDTDTHMSHKQPHDAYTCPHRHDEGGQGVFRSGSLV